MTPQQFIHFSNYSSLTITDDACIYTPIDADFYGTYRTAVPVVTKLTLGTYAGQPVVLAAETDYATFVIQAE